MISSVSQQISEHLGGLGRDELTADLVSGKASGLEQQDA
jgi:hypothetical protein